MITAIVSDIQQQLVLRWVVRRAGISGHHLKYYKFPRVVASDTSLSSW